VVPSHPYPYSSCIALPSCLQRQPFFDFLPPNSTVPATPPTYTCLLLTPSLTHTHYSNKNPSFSLHHLLLLLLVVVVAPFTFVSVNSVVALSIKSVFINSFCAFFLGRQVRIRKGKGYGRVRLEALIRESRSGLQKWWKCMGYLD